MRHCGLKTDLDLSSSLSARTYTICHRLRANDYSSDSISCMELGLSQRLVPLSSHSKSSVLFTDGDIWNLMGHQMSQQSFLNVKLL